MFAKSVRGAGLFFEPTRIARKVHAIEKIEGCETAARTL